MSRLRFIGNPPSNPYSQLIILSPSRGSLCQRSRRNQVLQQLRVVRQIIEYCGFVENFSNKEGRCRTNIYSLFVRCFGLVSPPPTESACHLVTFRKNARWGCWRHPCGPAGTFWADFFVCTRQGILTYSFPGSEVLLAKLE